MEADGAVHLDAVDAGPGGADGFRRGRGEALADEEAFDGGFGFGVGFDLDFGEAEEVGLDGWVARGYMSSTNVGGMQPGLAARSQPHWSMLNVPATTWRRPIS